MQMTDANTTPSAFWSFVLVNISFRGTPLLVLKSEPEVLISGAYSGGRFKEEFKLLRGILVPIPIGMFLSSLSFKRHVRRPLTSAALSVSTTILLPSEKKNLGGTFQRNAKLSSILALLCFARIRPVRSCGAE